MNMIVIQLIVALICVIIFTIIVVFLLTPTLIVVNTIATSIAITSTIATLLMDEFIGVDFDADDSQCDCYLYSQCDCYLYSQCWYLDREGQRNFEGVLSVLGNFLQTVWRDGCSSVVVLLPAHSASY